MEVVLKSGATKKEIEELEEVLYKKRIPAALMQKNITVKYL